MVNHFAVASHWRGGFDEPGIQAWAEQLRGRLNAPDVSLGLIFMGPEFFAQSTQVLEILRVHARIPLLAGCSGQGQIVGAEELEQAGGLTLGLYHVPGSRFEAVHFVQEQVEEADGPGYWPLKTGLGPQETNGWLAFIDPFHIDSEAWLRTWNEGYPSIPVRGGLASGEFNEPLTQLYLNGEVFESGGIAVGFGGKAALTGITSQGCTPIGQTWTLTHVEQNIIHKIGNRRAYDVLAETYEQLSPAEQKHARGNLFIGIVVNEYLEDFHRGDFLVRNVLGADPLSGSIAVGALPREGQTIQFQHRSAAAATEDLNALIARARGELGHTPVYGGCLCSCNGRGKGLFGDLHHDARAVQESLGPLALTGFFCNGEIGPIGQRNFLHGYTASLALFVER